MSRACHLCGKELIRRDNGESHPKFARRTTCSRACSTKLSHLKKKGEVPKVVLMEKSGGFHPLLDKFLYGRVA